MSQLKQLANTSMFECKYCRNTASPRQFLEFDTSSEQLLVSQNENRITWINQRFYMDRLLELGHIMHTVISQFGRK